jgi:hypothetical protein
MAGGVGVVALALCVLLAHRVVREARAASYTVGNSAGWDISADLPSWADGKTFNVGDVLGMSESGYHPLPRWLMIANGLQLKIGVFPPPSDQKSCAHSRDRHTALCFHDLISGIICFLTQGRHDWQQSLYIYAARSRVPLFEIGMIKLSIFHTELHRLLRF